MKVLIHFGLLWLIAAADVPQMPPLKSSPEVTLKTLDSEIPRIELTAGAEAIGGATIEDAVAALRLLAEFPICVELIEYDKEKDALSLGAALEQLRAMKTRQGLTLPDEARLKRYEELADTEDVRTPIGFKKKTFTLVENNLTVRAFLDRLMQLDNAYVWRNEGTNQAPVIVIQPRTKSALDWSVPSICGSPQDLSSTTLYGPGGKLTVLLQAHSISRVEVSNKRLPGVQVDLCRDHLTARDALDLTIGAAGHDLSWSLSGIKGLRWLSFQ
jgi:hypothetical protein